LNAKVATAESALHDDSAVATLETEVNWFSDETSRLKSHSMSMRKDMHHILSRISALNEQRRFLNDQLKQVLKRSKVLEVEINGTATLNSAGRRKSNGELLPGTQGLQSTEVDLDPESAEDYYGLSPKDQGVSGLKKDGLGLWKSNRISRTHSGADELRNSQIFRQTIIKDALIPSSTHKTFNNDRSLGSRKDPGSQLDLLLSIRQGTSSTMRGPVICFHDRTLSNEIAELHLQLFFSIRPTHVCSLLLSGIGVN
jgi:hypothetical protein